MKELVASTVGSAEMQQLKQKHELKVVWLAPCPAAAAALAWRRPRSERPRGPQAGRPRGVAAPPGLGGVPRALRGRLPWLSRVNDGVFRRVPRVRPRRVGGGGRLSLSRTRRAAPPAFLSQNHKFS